MTPHDHPAIVFGAVPLHEPLSPHSRSSRHCRDMLQLETAARYGPGKPERCHALCCRCEWHLAGRYIDDWAASRYIRSLAEDLSHRSSGYEPARATYSSNPTHENNGHGLVRQVIASSCRFLLTANVPCSLRGLMVL